MYEDIRENINAYIEVLDKFNTITDTLVKTKRDFIDTGDFTFSNTTFLTYISSRKYRKNENYDIGNLLMTMKCESTGSCSSIALKNPRLQSKSFVINSSDRTQEKYFTSFNSNANDIPEEELFQLNTKFSDTELCWLYIEEYYKRMAIYNFNFRLYTEYKEASVENETLKAKRFLDDLEDFKKSIMEKE